MRNEGTMEAAHSPTSHVGSQNREVEETITQTTNFGFHRCQSLTHVTEKQKMGLAIGELLQLLARPG